MFSQATRPDPFMIDLREPGFVLGRGRDWIMAGDEQIHPFCRGGDQLGGGDQLSLWQPAACRDAGAGRIEPEDRGARVKRPEPRVRAFGCEVAEISLESGRAVGAEGVAVVVAGDDRDPRRVFQKAGESGAGVMKFVGQGGCGQVAGDQDVVGIKALHPLDEIRNPLEAEATAAAGEERSSAQQTLAQEPHGVEGVTPEMDVGEMDDSHHCFRRGGFHALVGAGIKRRGLRLRLRLGSGLAGWVDRTGFGLSHACGDQKNKIRIRITIRTCGMGGSNGFRSFARVRGSKEED